MDGDEPEFELEHFKCLALQHKTKDYVATVARYPETLIFVHVQDDTEKAASNGRVAYRSTRGAPGRQSSQTGKMHFKRKVFQHLGQRTHVKHFKEEVSKVEILPGARYTVICLQTSIYIYKKNSRVLFDIVPCSSPVISSAIYKSFEDKLVLAYLSKDDPNETVLVHDYSVNSTT